VNCWKCSQPIALTDIVESNIGHLSHVECSRPRSLTPDERHLLFVYCLDHVVANACPVVSACASWSLPPIRSVVVSTCALGAAGISPRTREHTSTDARSFPLCCWLEHARCGRRRSVS
jgi:hypothetical protein